MTGIGCAAASATSGTIGLRRDGQRPITTSMMRRLTIPFGRRLPASFVPTAAIGTDDEVNTRLWKTHHTRNYCISTATTVRRRAAAAGCSGSICRRMSGR